MCCKCLGYVEDLAKRDIGVTIVATPGASAHSIDDNKVYPASYDSSNIIVVAKADMEGNIASFSSYGPSSSWATHPHELHQQ